MNERTPVWTDGFWVVDHSVFATQQASRDSARRWSQGAERHLLAAAHGFLSRLSIAADSGAGCAADVSNIDRFGASDFAQTLGGRGAWLADKNYFLRLLAALCLLASAFFLTAVFLAAGFSPLGLVARSGAFLALACLTWMRSIWRVGACSFAHASAVSNGTGSI